MKQNVNVFHDEGVLFIKLEDTDTGISYVSVPPEDLAEYPENILLVRHGNHTTNRCGYYPYNLLFKPRYYRERIAAKYGKRPPSETWVRGTIDKLKEAGYNIISQLQTA